MLHPAELGSTDAEQPQAGRSCRAHLCPGAASAGRSPSQPKQQLGVQLRFQRQLSSLPPSNPFHRHGTGLPRHPLTIRLQSTQTKPQCCPPEELLSHCRWAQKAWSSETTTNKASGLPLYSSVFLRSFHRTEVFYLLNRTCSKAIITSVVMLTGFVQQQLCSCL